MTDINKLIETEPFTESTVVALEDNLRRQLASEIPYNFEANKILMKNYQVKPVRANVNFIADILLLGVMRMPSTDYLSLSYIVPVKNRPDKNASTQTIANLVKLLEQGQYSQFWQVIASQQASRIAAEQSASAAASTDESLKVSKLGG